MRHISAALLLSLSTACGVFAHLYFDTEAERVRFLGLWHERIDAETNSFCESGIFSTWEKQQRAKKSFTSGGSYGCTVQIKNKKLFLKLDSQWFTEDKIETDLSMSVLPKVVRP